MSETLKQLLQDLVNRLDKDHSMTIERFIDEINNLPVEDEHLLSPNWDSLVPSQFSDLPL